MHLLDARTRSSSGQNTRDWLSPLTFVRPSSNSRTFFGSADTFDWAHLSTNLISFACIVPRARSLPTSAFLSRGSPFGAFRSRLLRPTKLSIRAPLSELASRCLVRTHRFAFRRHQKRAPLSRLTSSAVASRILGMLAWATSAAILFRGPLLRRSRAPVDAFGRLAFGTFLFRGSYLSSFMRIFRCTHTCRLSMNLFRGSCCRLRAYASFDTHARVALTSDSHATAFQRSIFLRTDRGQASARDFAHGKFTPRTLLSQPPRSLAPRDARARGLAARAHLQRIVIEKVWRFRLRIRRPARASEPSIQNPARRTLLSQHPPSANSR